MPMRRRRRCHAEDAPKPTQPKKVRAPRGPKKPHRRAVGRTGGAASPISDSLVPIKPVAPESWTKKRPPESAMWKNPRRVSAEDLHQRQSLAAATLPTTSPIHLPAPHAGFHSGAQMPEVKIAALRDLAAASSRSTKATSTTASSMGCSVPGATPRRSCLPCTGKNLSRPLHHSEAWDYFRPFIEKLGDPETAARTLSGPNNPVRNLLQHRP